MIRFFCKSCYHKIRVEDDLAGRKLKCPKCRAVNFVPARASASDQIDDNAGPSVDALQLRPDATADPPPPRDQLGSGLPLDDVTASAEPAPPLATPPEPAPPLAIPPEHVPPLAPPPPQPQPVAPVPEAADEVSEELADLIHAAAPGARGRPIRRPVPVQSNQSKVVLIVVLAVLLVGGAIAGMIMLRSSPSDQPTPGPETVEPEPQPAEPPAPAPQAVATPAIVPRGRVIARPLTVRIRCATLGATVRYTLDGPPPTKRSPAATAAGVTVKPGSVLRVRAYREGYTPSRMVSERYGRAAVTQEEVAAIRSATRKAVADAGRIDPGQTVGKLLEQAKATLAAADKAYADGQYGQARQAYDEAASFASQARLADDTRAVAIAARDKALRLLGQVAPIPIENDPKGLRKEARKEADLAARDFEKGRFNEARGMWEAAAELAGKLKAQFESDQVFGPWELLCEAVAEVYLDVYDRGTYDADRFRSYQRMITTLYAALPAKAPPALTKVRKAGQEVLTAMAVLFQGQEEHRVKPSKAADAARGIYRKQLKRELEAFAAAYSRAVVDSSRPMTAKITRFLKAVPQQAGNGGKRCPWCKGTGLMPCTACLVKGIPTGKAPCPRCGGKGYTTCPTCGGTGSRLCPQCRGKRTVVVRQGRRSVVLPCDVCKATGYVHGKADKPLPGRCPTCEGKLPKGTIPCLQCGSTGLFGECTVCKGTRRVPCTHCPAGKAKRAAAASSPRPAASGPAPGRPPSRPPAKTPATAPAVGEPTVPAPL